MPVTATPPRLSLRQLELLVLLYDSSRGEIIRYPSVRKLAARAGLAVSTTFNHLSTLHDLKCVDSEPGVGHSVHLTPLGERVVEQSRKIPKRTAREQRPRKRSSRRKV
jgi:DNA-binding IclR family transcriptional regulator